MDACVDMYVCVCERERERESVSGLMSCVGRSGRFVSKFRCFDGWVYDRFKVVAALVLRS